MSDGQPDLYDSVEQHYLNPAAEVAERRRALADERMAYGFAIQEALEATLRVEMEHPEVWDRLPGDMKIEAAYYAERKRAAERVAARKEAE